VIHGNLLVVPIGQSIMYFEPIYLQAERENTIPEMKRVIIAYGSKVVMEPTVREALAKIFGGDVGLTTTTTEPGGTPPTTVPGQTTTTTSVTGLPTDLESLAALANDYYLRAIEAQRAGEWAEYGRLIDELGRVLEAMVALQ